MASFTDREENQIRPSVASRVETMRHRYERRQNIFTGEKLSSEFAAECEQDDYISRIRAEAGSNGGQNKNKGGESEGSIFDTP